MSKLVFQRRFHPETCNQVLLRYASIVHIPTNEGEFEILASTLVLIKVYQFGLWRTLSDRRWEPSTLRMTGLSFDVQIRASFCCCSFSWPSFYPDVWCRLLAYPPSFSCFSNHLREYNCSYRPRYYNLPSCPDEHSLKSVVGVKTMIASNIDRLRNVPRQ